MQSQSIRGALFVLLVVALCWIPGVVRGQPITEVTVIYGGSSGIQAPTGFTKIPRDLNSGAGGDYVYVCYKRGVGAPITGLYVTKGWVTPNVPEHCTIVPVDLNRTVGGDYIYLWYTKDPSCAVVDDLIVLFNNEAVPDGYTKINYDLNRNAGGDFIYFCYRDR
jgi:hypothetical protein